MGRAALISLLICTVLGGCEAHDKAPLANSSEETAGNAPAPNRIDKNAPSASPDDHPVNGQAPAGDENAR